jgi:hypothetical protein
VGKFERGGAVPSYNLLRGRGLLQVLSEAGHILYLRILFPIHIQVPKKDIIVLDLLPDQIKTLIYQQHSKEIANHSSNSRNGSAKGKILPLKSKIWGTER